MIAACQSVGTGPEFLGSLLGTLDCHSSRIAEQSFAFLGSAGGPAGTLLLTAVTLIIAIVGYRLMFGPHPTIGEGAALALKIGIALALVTSWPAVSRVIAGPVLNGPAELSAWAGSDLEARLVRSDAGIAAVTSWGTGRDDIRSPRTADGEFAANEAATVPLADSLAFSGARLSFLLTAIASIGFLKLATAVLIGLAPLFAGLLLFDRTRGVFAGWARGLFALLVAGTAVRLVLSLEAALVEPWLAELIARRQAFIAAPSAAVELFAITMAFALITAAIIAVVFRLCLSLELPVLRVTWPSSQFSQAGARTDAARTRIAHATQDLAPSERAVRTVAALERVDSWRETARIIHGWPAATPAAHQIGAFTGSHTPAAPRSGRPTLISRRRDRRA